MNISSLFHKPFKSFFLVIGFTISQASYGYFELSGDVWNNSNFDMGTWEGSQLSQLNKSFCLESSSITPGLAWNIALPYKVKIQNNNGSGFTLNNGSGQSLPFEVSFTNQNNSDSFELTHNVFTSNTDGSTTPCTSSNAHLTFGINDANLFSATSGTYTGSFIFETIGGVFTWGTKNENFTLSVTLNDVIRISDIDDFIFGSHTGLGTTSPSLTDDICIYRNSTGNYQVTASGSGSGGDFTLSNGADTMTYTAQWNDGNGFNPLQPNTPLSNQGNVFNSNINCNAGSANNASLKIDIDNSELQSVPAGTYQGVITIMVAPQ